jgi:hypothetical protein
MPFPVHEAGTWFFREAPKPGKITRAEYQEIEETQ